MYIGMTYQNPLPALAGGNKGGDQRRNAVGDVERQHVNGEVFTALMCEPLFC